MSFRIYTKTGDQGTTALLGGSRVSKAHLRIEAYGTTDELNSYIGLCGDLVSREPEKKMLREIQDRLFTMGSALASDPGKEIKMKIPDLKEEDITTLEKEIDRMTAALPEMKNFILPGGHVSISHLHIARCICRRAERCCVRLQEDSEVASILIKYLNRLSDYLFTLARFEGMNMGVEEIPWRPRS